MFRRDDSRLRELERRQVKVPLTMPRGVTASGGTTVTTGTVVSYTGGVLTCTVGGESRTVTTAYPSGSGDPVPTYVAGETLVLALVGTTYYDLNVGGRVRVAATLPEPVAGTLSAGDGNSVALIDHEHTGYARWVEYTP